MKTRIRFTIRGSHEPRSLVLTVLLARGDGWYLTNDSWVRKEQMKIDDLLKVLVNIKAAKGNLEISLRHPKPDWKETMTASYWYVCVENEKVSIIAPCYKGQ